jgi:AhpD family alkylhydroperoxidase
MSRITAPTPESVSGATAEIYAQIRKTAGGVPNTYAVIGAYRPAALKAILHADGVLAGSTLSKQDQETIKLLVSEIAGCDYCVAAHSLLGGYTEQHLVDISLAIAVITFTNIFNRINDTDLDFPAVA